MSRKEGAKSLYRGLRVTLTEHPGGEQAIVTVGAKLLTGRWDHWSHLVPALRVDLESEIDSPEKALLVMQIAIERALREIGDR